MPLDSSGLLVLSNAEARELAGKSWTFRGARYCFRAYDPAHPGQPPWRAGAEGKAYPLLGPSGAVAAYLKFFARVSQKRLKRTAWLIGQQLHTRLPVLAAAPLFWIDTRHASRPDGLAFDLAGSLAEAVPGETWQEFKQRLAEGRETFPEECRWRCVRDLIRGLCALEQAGIIHGDLSPNNIIVDAGARPDRPALYLIDFDAFVAAEMRDDGSVAVGEGGAYGTDGYCPADLGERAAAGDLSIAPYSDRHGRDMLLLELLLMRTGFSPDDPPRRWEPQALERHYQAARARSAAGRAAMLRRLDPAAVFTTPEDRRPESRALARDLGVPVPPSMKSRPAVCIWTPTAAPPPTPVIHPPAQPPSSPASSRRAVRTRQSAGRAFSAILIGGIVLAVATPLLHHFGESIGFPIGEAAAWGIVQGNERMAARPLAASVGGSWLDRSIAGAFRCATYGALAGFAALTLLLAVRGAVDSDRRKRGFWLVHAVGGAVGGAATGPLAGALIGGLLGALLAGIFGNITAAAGWSVDDWNHPMLVLAPLAVIFALILVRAFSDPSEPDSFNFRMKWLLYPICGGAALAALMFFLRGPEPAAVFAGHTGVVTGVAVSADGKFVASSGADGTVRLWRVGDGEPMGVLRGHQGAVNGVAISPNGKLLASAGADGTVRLWTMDGQHVRTLREVDADKNKVFRAAFSPDGKRLAAAGDKGAVRLWDVESGRLERTFEIDYSNDCLDVGFSPDGKTVAAVFDHIADIRLWPADGGDSTVVPTKGACLSMAFDPGRPLVAAGTPQGVGRDAILGFLNRDAGWVRLYGSPEGKPRGVGWGHSGPVVGLAFRADGKVLASAGGADRTVRLWYVGDAVTPIAVLKGPADETTSVAVSADGSLVAAGCADGAVCIWRDGGAWLWK
jgi:hypothetical protein